VLVIVRTVLISMPVVMAFVGTVAMLVRMRVFVCVAVLMGVLVRVRDAVVRVFVSMSVLVGMIVLMSVFVFPFHRSP
jgi:hypothetical protein